MFKDPLYKDHIYELYNKSLKEKLSTHIQRPTTVSFARHDGSRSSYSLAARKPKSVTDSEMPKENVQGLRQEVEDFN